MDNTNEEILDDDILRLPQVKAKTGLSRPTIYRYIRAGLFPAQISLGGKKGGKADFKTRSVGWSKREVNAWIAERKRDSSQENEEAKK